MFIRNSIRHLHPTDVASMQRAPSTARRGATRTAPPAGNCSHLGSSTSLGARASRPHRVSEGKMPSLQETSSGNCSHLGSSTTLGVRASCPHRVSKGKMPSPQEISSGNCSPVGSSASLGARASRPHRVSEGRMPSLQETCEHVLRCCVSTRQYAIMRRLNECEARHRNGI